MSGALATGLEGGCAPSKVREATGADAGCDAGEGWAVAVATAAGAELAPGGLPLGMGAEHAVIRAIPTIGAK
ncbi:MAG: hypothetical protein NVSMB2_07690 [Chloroflexota bacterium]